ncbi:MAG: hypothetical protein V8S98_10215 [Lachnospiraceae bacterium]
MEQLLQKWHVHGFTDTDGQIHLLIPVEKKAHTAGAVNLQPACRSKNFQEHSGVFPGSEGAGGSGPVREWLFQDWRNAIGNFYRYGAG